MIIFAFAVGLFPRPSCVRPCRPPPDAGRARWQGVHQDAHPRRNFRAGLQRSLQQWRATWNQGGWRHDQNRFRWDLLLKCIFCYRFYMYLEWNDINFVNIKYFRGSIPVPSGSASGRGLHALRHATSKPTSCPGRGAAQSPRAADARLPAHGTRESKKVLFLQFIIKEIY